MGSQPILERGKNAANSACLGAHLRVKAGRKHCYPAPKQQLKIHLSLECRRFQAKQSGEKNPMKFVAAMMIAALSITDVFAQTYECMSKVTPGAIYLSYGTPCPPGTAAKARTQTILKADAHGQYFA